jgi:hypothetical protein
MRAHIYRKPRNTMQSGQAGTDQWVLEYETGRRVEPDPLMGWIGGGSTQSQVHLTFETQEEAVAFANKQGLPVDLEIPPAEPVLKPKVYADNFRYGRMENWTH